MKTFREFSDTVSGVLDTIRKYTLRDHKDDLKLIDHKVKGLSRAEKIMILKYLESKDTKGLTNDIIRSIKKSLELEA